MGWRLCCFISATPLHDGDNPGTLGLSGGGVMTKTALWLSAWGQRLGRKGALGTALLIK